VPLDAAAQAAPAAVGVTTAPPSAAVVPVIEAQEPTVSPAPASSVATAPPAAAAARATAAPRPASGARAVGGGTAAPNVAAPAATGATTPGAGTAGAGASVAGASPAAASREPARTGVMPGSPRAVLEDEIGRLRAQAKAVQEEPKGSKAFDALEAEVGRVARRLPEAEQRKVLADVSAAERSLELDPLLSAINKLTRAARELP
jgi:hypothetical protein